MNIWKSWFFFISQENYLDVYKRTLLEDLTSETSGDFRKLLVSMATSDRDESYTVDKEAAAKDARLLFDVNFMLC